MDKKYRVEFRFSATIGAKDSADALSNAAFKLTYDFFEVRRPSITVIEEIDPKLIISERAMAEAPYADQVTVREAEEAPATPPDTQDRRGPVERSVGGFLRRVVNGESKTGAVPPVASPVNAADDIPF